MIINCNCNTDKMSSDPSSLIKIARKRKISDVYFGDCDSAIDANKNVGQLIKHNAGLSVFTKRRKIEIDEFIRKEGTFMRLHCVQSCNPMLEPFFFVVLEFLNWKDVIKTCVLSKWHYKYIMH